MYSLLFSAKITLIIDIIKFYHTFFSIYYTKELILIINIAIGEGIKLR